MAILLPMNKWGSCSRTSLGSVLASLSETNDDVNFLGLPAACFSKNVRLGAIDLCDCGRVGRLRTVRSASFKGLKSAVEITAYFLRFVFSVAEECSDASVAGGWGG